jgi:hypothetical protein
MLQGESGPGKVVTRIVPSPSPPALCYRLGVKGPYGYGLRIQNHRFSFWPSHAERVDAGTSGLVATVGGEYRKDSAPTIGCTSLNRIGRSVHGRRCEVPKSVSR